MSDHSRGLLRRRADDVHREQPDQFLAFLAALRAVTNDQHVLRVFEDAGRGPTVAEVLQRRYPEEDLDRLMDRIRDAGAEGFEDEIEAKQAELEALRTELAAWHSFIAIVP